VWGQGAIHGVRAFLGNWGKTRGAAEVVGTRRNALDGNAYEILRPLADHLSAEYPLAATLALRAMIDFTLENNRHKRYRYAAKHLADCESLAMAISDFEDVEPHDAYVTRLRREQARKQQFWRLARSDV